MKKKINTKEKQNEYLFLFLIYLSWLYNPHAFLNVKSMKLKLWLNSILEKKNDLLNQVQCTEVHWNNSERDNKITIKAYYCIKSKVKVKSGWKEYTRKELLNLI